MTTSAETGAGDRPDSSSIGAALHARRAALNLSQRELARRANLNQSTISNLESGATQTATLPILAALAGALSCSPQDLAGDLLPIENEAAATTANGIHSIPLDRISASPLNPRKSFDDAALNELADSMAAQGLLQNLVVRANPAKPGYWIIVAGERRFRAANILAARGIWAVNALIPAKVIDADENQHRTLAIIENLQRAEVKPLEEAQAFRDLMAMPGWSADRVANAIGKSSRHVQLRIALLTRLDGAVLNALETETITLAHARALTAAPVTVQLQLLDRIMRGDPSLRRGEDISAQIRATLWPASRSIFDLSLYTGDRSTDPVTGEELLLDAATCRDLQMAAVRARVITLRTAFAWVDVKAANGWWQPGGADRIIHADNADNPALPRGAVIRVAPDYTVTEFLDLVELPKPATISPADPGDDDDDPTDDGDDDSPAPARVNPVDAISDERKRAAIQAKAVALQTAVDEHPTAWLAIICTALLGRDLVAGIALGPAAPAMTLVTVTRLSNAAERHGITDDTGSDDVLRALLAAPESELLDYAKALITSRCGQRWWPARANLGDNPAILALAHETGAAAYLDPDPDKPERRFASYAEIMAKITEAGEAA